MQLPTPNYDEALVPSFELPELLRGADGSVVSSSLDWQTRRRPGLLHSFRTHVYGDFDAQAEVEVTRVVTEVPCSRAVRRTELDVRLVGAAGSSERAPVVRVLIFTPSAGHAPYPAFLGLNLFGNQTVHPDERIRLAQGWVPDSPELGLSNNRSSEASRGLDASRFGTEMLAARGYALITAYVGDIAPDSQELFRQGAYSLLPTLAPTAHDPGVLAAWAFGLSRMLDAVMTLPIIDAKRVAVFGHSRLGKAALWAAAQDTRFALAISNESGCGGAALSRRRFGERLLHINERFPHWFCPAFHAFNEREQELPVDQHQLLALLAPRPLYVGSAADDLWADPAGERLACVAASPAYELFGLRGLADHGRPGLEHLGYHVRPGRHDLTARDLWHYLDFTDRHFGVDSPSA